MAGHILQEQGGGPKKFEAIKTHADSAGSFEARETRKNKEFHRQGVACFALPGLQQAVRRRLRPFWNFGSGD